MRSTLLGVLCCFACSSPAEPKADAPAAKPDAAVASEASKDAADQPAAEQPVDAEAPVPADGGGPVIDHTVNTIDGQTASLADYRGKALLIVNTASECGFTPQYAGLQELYGRYKDQGLVVMGFPSNDFGAQEPGTPDEIKAFVASKYAVDFPMFDKLHTKGAEQAPLYTTLTTETGEGIAGEVEWNFTKFLVDPEGRVVARFASDVPPMSEPVVEAVKKVLPKAG